MANYVMRVEFHEEFQRKRKDIQLKSLVHGEELQHEGARMRAGRRRALCFTTFLFHL